MINDLANGGRDRLHDVKRRRPIGAGQVSPAAAVVLAGVLVLLLGAALLSGLRPAGRGRLRFTWC